MNQKHDWSDYQKAIFKDIANGTGHTVVQALAGSGKTSTIVEGFKYVPRGKKVLMVAFNKSIAEELKQRAPHYVDVFTLHALGYRAIKQAFGNVKLEYKKCQTIVESLIGKDDWEMTMSICKTVSLIKGFLFDTPDKVNEVMDKFGIETFDMERKDFIKHTLQALRMCKETKQIIDFDDMVWFPFVYGLDVGKFDVVFIDETQDLNTSQIIMALSACKKTGRIIAVGDKNQCVEENTLLETVDDKFIKIKDSSIGDEVLSYENGKNVLKKIINKSLSSWDHGYKVTTKSGQKITMSPTHKLWASSLQISNQYIVYLMYRPDLGFRVGKTNTWQAKTNRFGARTSSESAQKFWVLDLVSSNEEAIYLEEWYSLTFGIPTCVFNGIGRGLNQDRINLIFKNFGDNGQRALDYKNYSFDNPHWIAGSFTTLSSDKHRQTIYINAHAKKNTQVALEWKSDSISKLLNKNGFTFHAGKKNNRLRRYFMSYVEALNFAKHLHKITQFPISERLSSDTVKEKMYLIPAASLFVGMKIPIKNDDNNNIILDEIISIERQNGIFYDIEIQDTANFFGNNILTHNCIYSFRGADSSAIDNIIKKLNARMLPLSITYRCPHKVVKLAQSVVPEFTAAPNAKEGEIYHIIPEQMMKQVRPGDFILSRTNAPLIKYCMALLKAGVPANIQGRDVGANLIAFIKKSKAKTIPKFIQYVQKWEKTEIERLTIEKKSTDSYQDKAECLYNLCETVTTIEELKETIDKLFNDVDDNHKVILSTTHKAKGLERDRVFVLANTYKKGLNQEETNLWYVAITRSKSELFLVNKTNKYDDTSTPKFGELTALTYHHGDDNMNAAQCLEDIHQEGEYLEDINQEFVDLDYLKSWED